jgi:hypothetical protein
LAIPRPNCEADDWSTKVDHPALTAVSRLVGTDGENAAGAVEEHLGERQTESGSDLLAKASVALAARKAIERAKGLLMQREGLSEGEAFARLRVVSQRGGQPMEDDRRRDRRGAGVNRRVRKRTILSHADGPASVGDWWCVEAPPCWAAWLPRSGEDADSVI